MEHLDALFPVQHHAANAMDRKVWRENRLFKADPLLDTQAKLLDLPKNFENRDAGTWNSA